MINTYVRKQCFTFLVLISCLIISTSFAIDAKTYNDASISVKVQQENADLNVLVKAPKNTSVQFYMFNTDGNLVKQMEITGTQKFSIQNLSKGIYLYELFKKDERLKRGDVQIK